MALLSIIRRWHLREQISLREIAKRLGISRNTVRRYLRAGVTEPVYPKRQSPSQLDDYVTKLEYWLKTERHKSRKQRRTIRQLYEDLRVLGYTGSYDRVAAFARQWFKAEHTRNKTAATHTFVPLRFAPGEAFQFDWSEDYAVINGERVKLQIAQFKLCYSRAFFLRAYPLQTHEMLFDAHNHAFAAFGSVPRRGIYDNMKTAVDKVRIGKARDVNMRFASMVSHYLFDAEFCNPAAGWEKGQIEKQVQDIRHRIWQTVPAFASLVALNDWLADQCRIGWQQRRHPEFDQTIEAVWSTEQPHLMAIGQSFDGFVEHVKPVSPTCLVNFERNRYSVPASFANRPISLRVYASRLLFVAEGDVVAEHIRRFNRNHERGQTIYDWRHYLAVVQRKPGALRNGAPFQELPQGFQRLQSVLLKRPGGDREMVEILALVMLHDEDAVLAAVELALETQAPAKQTVLNILSRLLDPQPQQPVIAHCPLSLTIEPQANVDRYDDLRNQEQRHAI